MTGANAIQANGHQSIVGILTTRHRADRRARARPATGEEKYSREIKDMETKISQVRRTFNYRFFKR